jgi:hypothetical protein
LSLEYPPYWGSVGSLELETKRLGVRSFINLKKLFGSFQIVGEHEVEARHALDFAVFNADQIAKERVSERNLAIQINQQHTLIGERHGKPFRLDASDTRTMAPCSAGNKSDCHQRPFIEMIERAA